MHHSKASLYHLSPQPTLTSTASEILRKANEGLSVKNNIGFIAIWQPVKNSLKMEENWDISSRRRRCDCSCLRYISMLVGGCLLDQRRNRRGRHLLEVLYYCRSNWLPWGGKLPLLKDDRSARSPYSHDDNNTNLSTGILKPPLHVIM